MLCAFEGNPCGYIAQKSPENCPRSGKLPNITQKHTIEPNRQRGLRATADQDFKISRSRPVTCDILKIYSTFKRYFVHYDGVRDHLFRHFRVKESRKLPSNPEMNQHNPETYNRTKPPARAPRRALRAYCLVSSFSIGRSRSASTSASTTETASFGMNFSEISSAVSTKPRCISSMYCKMPQR